MRIVEYGDGEPLVLVPGIQGRWEYMRPAIDALAPFFHVLTFALCGEPDARCRLDRIEGPGQLHGPGLVGAGCEEHRASDDLRRVVRRPRRAPVWCGSCRSSQGPRPGVDAGARDGTCAGGTRYMRVRPGFSGRSSSPSRRGAFGRKLQPPCRTAVTGGRSSARFCAHLRRRRSRSRAWPPAPV